MIWRPKYETKVARNVVVPTFGASQPERDTPCKVLLGGFHFQAQLQIAVWRKLLAADATQCPWIQAYFLPDPSETDTKLLHSLIPPSEHDRTFILEDQDLVWRRLISPATNEECFAAVMDGTTARIIMKGIPTEDAWEAFLAEIPS